MVMGAALLFSACADHSYGGTTPTLTSMEITPAMNIVAVGKTKRIIAELIDDKGERFDVSGTADWASDAPTIATVGSGGLVKGVSGGMANITATRDGKTGSATVMVVASDVTKIDVAPAMVGLVPGETKQLTATATLGNMTTVDVTQTATWTSNNKGAVTVSKGSLRRSRSDRQRSTLRRWRS